MVEYIVKQYYCSFQFTLHVKPCNLKSVLFIFWMLDVICEWTQTKESLSHHHTVNIFYTLHVVGTPHVWMWM